MRPILLAPLILALGLPLKAEVDPKIHEMCLSAVDYKGCVESQKGSFIKNFFKQTTKSKINKKDLRKRCELGNESGIKNEADAKYIYEKTGIKNFLIGESLLKSDNPTELLKKFTQIVQ